MAEHDARVKEREAAFHAEAARRAKEAKDKAERTLGPRPPTTEEIADELKKGAYYATGMRSEAPAEDPERPSVDASDDWIPGTDAEPEEEVAPLGTALVLASVYDQREQDLNEDVRWGLEPGTTARKRHEREEWYARREAERAEREAANAAAEPEPEAPAVIETEKQRERREKREAAEHEKWRKKWAREDERAWRKEQKEHAKRDHDAYRAGMKIGEKIGIDPQVKARADAKRLKG